MADRDLSSISSALSNLIAGPVVSQINRAVVLAQILGVKPADNKTVTWDVKLGTATPTTAPISDGADVSTYNADTKIPAVLNYAEYHDAFALTGRALAAAAASGRPEDLANLFLEEMQDSVERLSSAIGYDVYNGDGTTDHIHGLFAASPAAIGDTGIYASINRATYSQWKGNVVDAAGAPLTFELIRDLRRKIYAASGEKPDLFITDPVQHERLGILFGANRRYVDQVRRADGQVIKLDGGYMVLEFDGISVVEDQQHPAQKFTALNTKRVMLRQLMEVQSEVTGSLGSFQLGGTPEEQLGVGKIKMAAFLHKLAKNGNKHKFALYVMPQLQVTRPNACGYITSLLA
jgi:hypothetical protein